MSADLIALAKQAGMIPKCVEIDHADEVLLHAFTVKDLQAFADLIRKESEAERDRLREALEKLARLGNGDQYGNSIGNDIARQALGAQS